MFGGRGGDSVDEVMGRGEGGGTAMAVEEAQGPGRSEAGEEEETTEKNAKRRMRGLEGGGGVARCWLGRVGQLAATWSRRRGGGEHKPGHCWGSAVDHC